MVLSFLKIHTRLFYTENTATRNAESMCGSLSTVDRTVAIIERNVITVDLIILQVPVYHTIHILKDLSRSRSREITIRAYWYGKLTATRPIRPQSEHTHLQSRRTHRSLEPILPSPSHTVRLYKVTQSDPPGIRIM